MKITLYVTRLLTLVAAAALVLHPAPAAEPPAVAPLALRVMSFNLRFASNQAPNALAAVAMSSARSSFVATVSNPWLSITFGYPIPRT
jgi:hypothetical protein